MNSYFVCYLNKVSPLTLTIEIVAIDSILSRRLLKSNSLITKQNALKDIFIQDKVYKITGGTIQPGFICAYTSEDNTRYGNNVFNSFVGDNIKITSLELWNDGSGIAKIKVWLSYDTRIQAHSSTGWLPEIKHITGTMQTFFTVR